jgi:formylglycine-generating enzyme required for sulfatase activity
MGGVAGALSRHSDGVLARLTQTEQQAARSILGRLITSEGTRSEKSEEELTTASGAARAALQALLNGRLLHARTEAGRSSYEIAHEALIASWGALRRWLEDDAGQRALQQRLEEASAEWERLGHTEDLLWRKRQLGEALSLDTAVLGPREQLFLRTSMSAMRRRSVLGWIAVLLLLLAAAAIYGVPRLNAHWDTQRFARERMAEAQRKFFKGRVLSQAARANREKALGLFNGNPPEGYYWVPPSPQEVRLRAEQQWERALADFDQAQAAFVTAEQALDDALERAPDHPEVRRLLAELTYERIEHGEAFFRVDDRARLQQRLERLTARDEIWKSRLGASAEFELMTTPAGASVELTPHDSSGKPKGEPMRLTTPIARTLLPPGAYHLRITHGGHSPINMPLLLERGRLKDLHLSLPRLKDIPEGYVYIPPDCFFAGSTDPEDVRKFLRSAPLQQLCLKEGFLIGRTEVTLRDWMEYLDSLPKDAPPQQILARQPSSAGFALQLTRGPEGSWSFALWQENGKRLKARERELILYPMRNQHQEQDWRLFPLAGVSPKDLHGYLAWLDRSGRVPGARLCSELEWTRAARGADRRRYPPGDRIEMTDANMDMTYGGKPDSRGPDEVGSHPASASPFGLLDMAGNAFEMVTPTTYDLGDFVILGGAWYYGSISTVVANRQAYAADSRDARVGARVCAPLLAR